MYTPPYWAQTATESLPAPAPWLNQKVPREVLSQVGLTVVVFNLTPPLTSTFCVGPAVPMPMLPSPPIRIFSVLVVVPGAVVSKANNVPVAVGVHVSAALKESTALLHGVNELPSNPLTPILNIGSFAWTAAGLERVPRACLAMNPFCAKPVLL